MAESKLRSALTCKKVTVPKLNADLEKCHRDQEIRMKLYLAREDLLKDEVKRSREDSKMITHILTISLSLISGILVGISL